MKIKGLMGMSLGLFLALAGATVVAQPSPDTLPPDAASPEGLTTPEGAPEPEGSSAEESITPESDSPADAPTPDSSIGGSPDAPTPDSNIGGSSDGSKKTLVACGPNSAASIVDQVRPGCHVLKVNSPPHQSGNGPE